MSHITRKLKVSGPFTSEVRIINLSEHGFWLLLHEQMLPVKFVHFPRFRAATIEQLVRVERATDQHLYWPRLDVDISIDSIRDPEAFPLVSPKAASDRQPVPATSQSPDVLDWSTCEAVEQQSERHGGAWLFRRTRVPIAALFENLAAGASIDQFVDWFPGVSLALSRAVLEHVARGSSVDKPPEIG